MTPPWPIGWMRGGKSRQQTWLRSPNDRTSFRLHHRHIGRRSTRPNVGGGSGSAWLSLPYLCTGRNERRQIGRAHVCNPVTHAHLVCTLLHEKTNNNNNNHNTYNT